MKHDEIGWKLSEAEALKVTHPDKSINVWHFCLTLLCLTPCRLVHMHRRAHTQTKSSQVNYSSQPCSGVESAWEYIRATHPALRSLPQVLRLPQTPPVTSPSTSCQAPLSTTLGGISHVDTLHRCSCILYQPLYYSIPRMPCLLASCTLLLCAELS